MRMSALGFAFFLSGASALVYQTVWQRIVALHTGIGLHSVAIIVSAFMLGLGIGSHLGGSLSVRLGARRSLLAFGLVEAAIAAFGATSAYLYYDLLYTRWAWLYDVPWRAAVLHAVGLGLPTTLMGTSLPLLVRGAVRTARSASRTIGILYGLNVLGAALGAIAGPALLVRHSGMRAALLAAAGANLVAGLAALATGRARRDDTEDDGEAVAGGVPPSTVGLGRWAALYASSGFCALGLELLWFRVFEVSVKASAFTFGALLAVFLLGNGMGSLVGSLLAARLGHPLRAFLLLQCALLVCAAGSLSLLVHLPAETGWLSWYVEHWSRSRVITLDSRVDALDWFRLYGIVPLLLFGVPTLLMGVSYPVLQRAVQDDARTSGRKVGLLQAANIVGCVLGSLVVGLVLLDRLGTGGTLVVLLSFGLVFAAVGMWAFGARTVFAPAALVVLVTMAAVPSGGDIWRRFHGEQPETSLVAEDATGVVMLVPDGGRWTLWSGGRRHSRLPFGGTHTLLGAAPAIVHPAPERVAVIGLGSGDTAWAAGCRPDVPQRISVYEIYAGQHPLLLQLARRADAPAGLARFLADPRFDFLVEDGRRALLRAGRDFDVIEMDALWPVSPYSGNLYSVEFFRLCAARLRPGGVMATWAPTRRVRASFAQAFPHVVAVGDVQVLVGSKSPLDVDVAGWLARLDAPAVRNYLGAEHVARIRTALENAVAFSPRRVKPDDLNLDLFPRDEFRTPEGR